MRKKVTDQDDKILALIKADLESAVFGVTTLLALGEDTLLSFVRTYGRRITEKDLGEAEARFKIMYAIDRPTSVPYQYLKYTSNEGIETYIFCGHCISVFVPNEEHIKAYKPVTDLTKPVEYGNTSRILG